MVRDLAQRFNVISGLSDHTLGSTAPVIATCMGAKIIEKHFILDRSIGGPDVSFSMDEKEFTKMVNSVRQAEKAVGQINYNLTEKQQKGREFSRSLYFVQDVKKGQKISKHNVKSIRPGFGLHPKYYDQILGKKVIESVEMGDRVEFKLIK